MRLGVVAGRRILVTLHRGRASSWDLNNPSVPLLAGTTTLLTNSTDGASRGLIDGATPTMTPAGPPGLLRHPALGPDVGRHPLQGHHRDGNGVFGDLGLFGRDHVHDHAPSPGDRRV